jgi:hypothetical protein
MRIARTLAVALMLLSVALLASPAPGHASPVPVSPTADIPIVGGLFGEDENEPDENEPDEGSQPARSTAGASSGTSLSDVILAFGLGMVATIFIARWYFRLRGWVRQLGRGRNAA